MKKYTHARVRIIKQILHYETARYTIAIKEGNFDEATRIKNAINELQAEMDTLMPHTDAETI
jgi:flagellar basal body P-ring protein FlgI